MPGENIQTISLEELKAAVNASAAADRKNNYTISQFRTCLENLNQVQHRFLEDPQNPPLLADAKELDEVVRVYTETSYYCSQYLKNPPAETGEATLSQLRVMETALNENLNFLSKVKFEEGMTLQGLLNQSRCSLLRLENKLTTRDAKSGAMSARVPLTVTKDGKKQTCFFTNDGMYDAQTEFQNLLKHAKNRCKKAFAGQPFMLQDIESMLERLNGEQAVSYVSFNVPQNSDFYKIYPTTVREDAGRFIQTMGNLDLCKGMNRPMAENEEFRRIFYNLAHDMSELRSRVHIQNEVAKVHNGSRIPQRNEAMSSIASLLGVGSLIAHSEQAILTDGVGLFFGTVMEKAQGSDVESENLQDPIFEIRDPKQLDTKGFKSDIADLMILDYLCGNTDRHAANLFYKTEKVDGETKVVGVQGIDNDTSFGTRTLESGELSSVRVMNRSMKNRLVSLTKPMLQATLQGYNLSQAEIDAVWKRKEQLEERLRKGKVEIVNGTEDWNRKKLENLKQGYHDAIPRRDLYYNSGESMIRMINTQRDYLQKKNERLAAEQAKVEAGEPVIRTDNKAEEQEKKAADKNPCTYQMLPGDFRQREVIYAKNIFDRQRAECDQIWKDMEKADHYLMIDSKEFKAFKAELSKLRTLQKKIAENQEGGLNAANSKRLYEEMQELSKVTREYFTKKDNYQLSNHGQVRFASALKISKLTDDAQKYYLAGQLKGEMVKQKKAGM